MYKYMDYEIKEQLTYAVYMCQERFNQIKELHSKYLITENIELGDPQNHTAYYKGLPIIINNSIPVGQELICKVPWYVIFKEDENVDKEK